MNLKYEDTLLLKEKIESRISIRDIMLDWGVELIDCPGGRKGTALCPFHNESNPSFSVDYEKNLYNCFSCHSSGDMYNFVSEKYETKSWIETIEFICRKYGIEVPDGSELSIEDYKKKIEILDQYHNISNKSRKREEFERIILNISHKIRYIINLKNMKSQSIKDKIFPILKDVDEMIESDDFDFQQAEDLDYNLDKKIYLIKEKVWSHKK